MEAVIIFFHPFSVSAYVLFSILESSTFEWVLWYTKCCCRLKVKLGLEGHSRFHFMGLCPLLIAEKISLINLPNLLLFQCNMATSLGSKYLHFRKACVCWMLLTDEVLPTVTHINTHARMHARTHAYTHTHTHTHKYKSSQSQILLYYI